MNDYHIHTGRCGHASGEMRQYVERAMEKGLAEIGFADHLPLLDRRDPSLTMSREELPLYIEEIDRLRREYPEITLKTGIEADYLPGFEEETAMLLDYYPFDYVIGSVHFIGSWGFDDPREKAGYSGKEPLEVYKEYFHTLQKAARTGLFDIMAHPDLIKKYDYRPSADVSDLYEETARAFSEAGAAIEINTAGLRKPVSEIYPHREFLETCRAFGVDLVFGSDAHAPEDVGRDFDLAVSLARDAGYDTTLTFTNRERRPVRIEFGGGSVA